MAVSEARRLSLQKARDVKFATGRLGGRPKGSLSLATIKKIQDKKSLEEAIRKRAGRIVNNLLLGSDLLDTQASKELLERGFGKVQQDLAITGGFSVKHLHIVALPVGTQTPVAAVEPSPHDGAPLVHPLSVVVGMKADS